MTVIPVKAGIQASIWTPASAGATTLALCLLLGCFSSVKRPLPPETLRPSGAFSDPLPHSHLLSPFGRRGRRYHTGIDIQVSRAGGEPVLASREGVVTRAGVMSGYGRIVEIRHPDGFSTRYAHLQKIKVRTKQHVKRSEVVGTVGRTGRASTPHLHFEILTPKFRFVNPRRFISK